MPSDTPSKLLDDYQPWPDVPDELLGSERRVRSGWQELLEHLAPLGRDELLEHFARGDQYLADAGVYFRQYGQDSSHEREWPLSHLPVIIHEREWTEIAAGFGYLFDSIGLLLVSGYTTTPGLVAAVIALAEIAFPVWLLVKGVNMDRWETRTLALETA